MGPIFLVILSPDELSRLRNALAGRFDVQQELGRGGMATVYLARDLKHQRPVALKVMRPEIAAALGAERFLREIRIAARLSHPHILQLFDSGEVKGRLFYVMPYVEGESLRHRLDREPRLPVSEAVRLVAEVAAGLDYAHQQGVVHRDIKPENILLHAGQAVVSDFGIARAIDAAASVDTGGSLTDSRVLMGTPRYMAPEQVAGDPVDGRADIYALGCVLYEMLAGEPPFTGPTAQSILARHTLDPAPAIRQIRPEVPDGVERTITTALAKDPAARFQTAGAMRDALTGAAAPPAAHATRPLGRRHLAASLVTVVAVAIGLWAGFHRSSAAAPPSLAVLPFVNQNAGPDSQYLADGITDELISALGQIGGMHVTARTSAFALPRGLDSRTIGERLNARLLLEGSVQWAGSKLRVTATLVEAATGDVRWSNTYLEEFQNVIDVEARITQAIVGSLRVRLTGVARPLVPHGTPNPAAHDLYLKGRYFLNQRGAGLPALQRSIEFFKQALALDSGYAQAWAGLAQAYGFQAGFGNTPPSDAFVQAKAAALHAVALDSGLALAHTSLAFIAIFNEWDWDAAKRELDRALALDSTEPATHLYLAWYLRCRGQLDASLEEMRTARRLDPLNQIFNARVGTLLYGLGRYTEAETEMRQALALDSTNEEARTDLGFALTLQHRYQEALATLEGDTTDRHPYPRSAYLGYTLGMANRRADAIALLQRLKRHARQRYITPETFAYVEAGLRDTAAALDWLEQGYRERSFFIWSIAADPVFYPLRGSPRYLQLVERIGLVMPPVQPPQ